MERGDLSLTLADVPVAMLAGGLAKRLGPITQRVPKCMVEVAGRPFIEHQLSLLKRNGIFRVVMCLGHLGDQVVDHIGNGSDLGMEVRYSFDGDKLLGTGGALRRALPMLGEAFWVLYGDSYLDIDYHAVFNHFASQDALGLMTVLRNNNRWDRSNVVFENGHLLCYDKRTLRPDMHFIDFGLSLLRREAAEHIPAEQESDLATLFHDLVANRQMIGYEMTHRFYEIGSHAGLQETQEYLQSVPHSY